MVEVPGKAGPQGHTGLRGGGARCADGGIRVTLTQCRQPDAGIYVWVEDWRGSGANANTHARVEPAAQLLILSQLLQ